MYIPKINRELLETLYKNISPYVNAQPRFIDFDYPHTFINLELVEKILLNFKPKFWLEIGSFTGGSAIRVARLIQKHSLETGIVCIDPFCGDVNMWEWEGNSKELGLNNLPYDFLKLEYGLPTMYQRFLANVMSLELSSYILPIQATSIVGIKLLKRLHYNNRISILPDVIYLDSAHEPDETLLELNKAWEILPKGGILLGDDWGWSTVREDVIKFAKNNFTDYSKTENFKLLFSESEVFENIFIFNGQWLLFKT